MADYEIIVIGAGHAGCEAALASARMGHETLLLTINMGRIAHMACNCSLGGPAKGHLVREIDALGGQQAVTTDATYTHIRMLNTGKGPAVQALRAQVDKRLYENFMRQAIMSEPRLDVKEAMVEELVSELASSGRPLPDPPLKGRETAPSPRPSPSGEGATPPQPSPKGEGDRALTPRRGSLSVRTQTGVTYSAKCVIVTTGTFLNGLIHIGETQIQAGRAGEFASVGLSDGLRKLGFELGRLKTGTTARVDKKSIDYSKCERQDSEPDAGPFSFMSGRIEREGLPCWLTYTTDRTREIIQANLGRSAMYGGRIGGVGPRYCPSIEDKIVKFPDKLRHQVFLEQEGWDTDEIYVQGMSTSLPEEVQLEFLQSIPGLEDVRMFRPGYAIEYDFAPPTQLKPSLETKLIDGLFFAGQINGTSGYEEAAAQGLMAAINASRKLRGKEPVVVGRSEGYIGVMIDDLVTKGVTDPYRLLTSRAEYRLLLRQDNADRRLTPLGLEVGLVDDARWERFTRKAELIDKEMRRLSTTSLGPSDTSALESLGIELTDRACSLEELLRRPELKYADIAKAAPNGEVPPDVAEQIETEVKYSGYIERQKQQVEQAAGLEKKAIPEDIDYPTIKSLSREAAEKLARVRPATLGQASRIAGVTPADVAMIAVHLKAGRR